VAELGEADAGEGPRRVLLEAGVPAELAAVGSDAGRQVASLAVIEAATRAGRDAVETARVYSALARRLRLDALSEVIGGLEPQSLWQAMERDALLDDLVTLTGLLCQRLLQDGVAEPEGLDPWFAARPELEASCARVTGDVLRDRGAGESADFSLHAMAVRKFGDLVRGL
jgi:NAD-specific glutamate dehydrogenase